MGDGGYDPCEYIFSHEVAMQRLISLLRNSQSYCTDTECFPEPPGPQQDSPAGGFNIIMFVMAWIVIGITLFLMRPQSARRNTGDQKPSNQGPQGGPPPPNTEVQ